MNNPLAGTDPSGYIADCILAIHCAEQGLPNPFKYPPNCPFCVSVGGDQSEDNGNKRNQSQSRNSENGETEKIGNQSLLNIKTLDDVTVPENWEPKYLALADDTRADQLDEADRKLNYLIDEATSEHFQAVEQALNDKSLTEERRAHLVEAQDNLRSAVFTYSRYDNPERLAQGGVDFDGGNPRIKFFRSMDKAMGSNGKPASGYGEKLRLGYEGIIDVIHHEGGHLIRPLHYVTNSQGGYSKLKRLDIEKVTNQYMLFLRNYEGR
ncbi:MAG: Uncharacterised protein [Pseudidiomarina mangrovi]|nr:MAG: Uncharacterised protein [Pseudidiomarina mangrovi]